MEIKVPLGHFFHNSLRLPFVLWYDIFEGSLLPLLGYFKGQSSEVLTATVSVLGKREAGLCASNFGLLENCCRQSVLKAKAWRNKGWVTGVMEGFAFHFASEQAHLLPWHPGPRSYAVAWSARDMGIWLVGDCFDFHLVHCSTSWLDSWLPPFSH